MNKQDLSQKSVGELKNDLKMRNLLMGIMIGSVAISFGIYFFELIYETQKPKFPSSFFLVIFAAIFAQQRNAIKEELKKRNAGS